MITCSTPLSQALILDYATSFDAFPGNDSSAIIQLNGRLGAENFPDLDQRIRNGEFTALVSEAQAYIKANPPAGLPYEILAVAYFQQGELQKAVDALKAATNLELYQSGAWTKLGIIMMESERVDDAERVFLKALNINEHDRMASQRLGLIYEYRKDYVKAIKYFRMGLEGAPINYLGVAVNLGRILNEIGQTKATIAVLEPRLKESDEIPEAHLILARAHLAQEQFQLALPRFQRALELNPDVREVELGLIMSLRGSGKLSSAQNRIDRLKEEHPDWLLPHYEQAEIYLAANRLDEATESLEAKTNLGVEPRYIIERLAKYHLDRGELDLARNHYEQVIATGEAKEVSYIRLSELLQNTSDVENSLAVLREGVKKYVDSSNLRFRLGSNLAANRRYADAVPILKEAADKAPHDPRILRAYALVQRRVGDVQGAVNTAGRLHKLLPNGVGEALLYATMLEANNDKSEAERVYRVVIASAPDNIVALNNLAFLLAGKGKLEEAEKFARRSVALAGDDSNILDTLGWVLYQQARYADAVVIFDHALQVKSDSAVIHYHSGLAHFRAKNITNARAALTEALKMAPDASWAKDAKSKLDQI